MINSYQFVLEGNPEKDGDPLTIIALYLQRVSTYPFPSWVRGLWVSLTYSQQREFLVPGGHEGRDVHRVLLQEILVHVFSTGLEKYPRKSIF